MATVWLRGFAVFERHYLRLLDRSLDHRGTVLAVAAALFVASLALLPFVGVELLPPFNQGEFRAEVRLPPGTPLERTDVALRDLSLGLAGDKAVEGKLQANYTVAGTGNRLDANTETGGENDGNVNLVLAPGAFNAEAQVMGAVAKRIETMPGAEYRYVRPTLFTLKTPLEVEFAGYDLEQLSRVSEVLRGQLLADPRYSEVRTTLTPGHPEIQVTFDQERAAALGLDTAVLADRVSRSVQGSVATRYRVGDREIDVLVRASAEARENLDAISNLIVNPEAGEPVRLSSVADVVLRNGPSEIRRADQVRTIVVSANIANGNLGTAQEELRGIINHLRIPPNVSVTLAGQSEEMEVSFRSLQFALALAIFLVYLVMASQFESLVHPFVILFTIPLAAIGAIV
jgi:HAE1 family hydrophobic/amphiphilic exporter-1